MSTQSEASVKTREKELEQYAQYRVEEAGYQLLHTAKIMQIVARDPDGDDAVNGNLVEFLGDLVAARAAIVIDEGNKRENWSKQERWK